MTMKGLTEEHKKLVVEILTKHFPDCKFYIFGSRFRGNFHESSDLDIAIEPIKTSLSLVQMGKSKEAFMNSTLPFRVDILDITKASPDFVKKILNESAVLS
jgi:predicted nucleotidyltransferase